ncbi:MAG TPA: DPP IV N-terminal domain-containing protein, partial [Prolixibacteraceae bacterium]|nr:DPP IV N-terminal domain-containing protein [Prolixibacteraceae bacterium]
MFKRITFFLIASVFVLGATFKAPAQVTPADYQRADSIMKLNDLVYNQVNSVNWIDSTSVFWYAVKTREGMAYTMVDAAKATRKPAFDVAKLVEQLNKQPGVKATAKSLQLQKLKFDLKANKFQFLFDKKYFTCNLKNYALVKDSVAKPDGPRPYWNEGSDELSNKPVTSPDSVWVAFIKNYNVYVRSKKDNKEIQLSFDGSAGDFYSSYFSWSPDSKKLA